MAPIDSMVYFVVYIVSYALAWYTWKEEKGGYSRFTKFFFTGHHPHRFIDTVYLEDIQRPDGKQRVGASSRRDSFSNICKFLKQSRRDDAPTE